MGFLVPKVALHRLSLGQLCYCSINARYSSTIRPAILGPFDVRIL